MKKLREHIAFKSIFTIVLLLVIFSAVISAIGFKSFTEALLSQYAEGAFLTAETAAEYVDADRIGEYAESGGTTEEYKAVWEDLDQLCNSSGSTFVYVILPDRTDYAHITFLFSTIDHDSDYNLYDFGYVRDTTNDEYREKYRALYDKEAERELVIRDRGFIETDPHITAMIGLDGSDGEIKGILCVQRQMDVLSSVRKQYILRIVWALILLVIAVAVSQSVFLHWVLLSPLKKISDEAIRFSTENVRSKEKLKDRVQSEDEIGQLAGSIDRMEEQIENYVNSITKITAEKERISTEMELATRIQTAMLPDVFPPFPERAEFDLYASMDPAREVGGDFYDFFLIDDDHLGLVMADVSGKGVPAALFMMASRIILANNAMTGKSPAKVLSDTNDLICSNNREEMFVTVWLGILEISSGKLTAANAGHEYPALRQEEGVFRLFKDKHGFVIGGMEGMKYKEYELFLKPGDRLFLYTDGIPEAADTDGRRFGVDEMLAALNAQPDGTPRQILKNVKDAVDAFTRGTEQFDDLTMLCLEYKGSSVS